jgi:hypothetical protein
LKEIDKSSPSLFGAWTSYIDFSSVDRLGSRHAKSILLESAGGRFYRKWTALKGDIYKDLGSYARANQRVETGGIPASATGLCRIRSD